MNHVPIPDEQFNKVARTSDLETPVDRFYDLIMAVFHSSIQEALNQHSRHPDREPNAGLVRNAAAWLQETMMPDVSQQDIAQKIWGTKRHLFYRLWFVRRPVVETVLQLCAAELFSYW